MDVLAIEDDGQGNLWIGSSTGLDLLDKVTRTFTHIRPLSNQGTPIDLGTVQALFRSNDGTLWIGTSQGLLKSSPGPRQGQIMERVEVAQNRRQDAISVTCLYVDPAGTIWIGTDHGIHLLERVVQRQSSGPSALSSNEEASVSYRPFTAHALPSSLASSHLVTIKPDRDGGVWIGTQDQGVLVITPSTGAVRHIAHDTTQPTSLADDWVEAIFLSHQGVMWVGSRHGVSYIDTARQPVATILGGDASSDSLRDSDVYSVFPRRDGSIWIGLSKHGIDILSPAGRRIAELRSASGTSAAETTQSLPQGTIGAIRESANGGVYIVTEHGLYLAEGADIPGVSSASATNSAVGHFHPRLKQLPIGADAAQGLYQILTDHDERGHEFLWLGGSNGLWTFDPSGSGPAVPARLKKPLTDPRIRVLLHSGNIMWVGTLNGLNRVNISTGDVDNILPDAANPQALGAGMISSLLIDRKGRLWVGTFSGGIHVLQGIDSQGRARFHRSLTVFRTTMLTGYWKRTMAESGRAPMPGSQPSIPSASRSRSSAELRVPTSLPIGTA